MLKENGNLMSVVVRFILPVKSAIVKKTLDAVLHLFPHRKVNRGIIPRRDCLIFKF